MLLADDDDLELDMSPDIDDDDEESRVEAERMFMQDQTDIVGENDPDDAEDDNILPDDREVDEEDEDA